MKLITNRYEIEYKDTYINGIEVDWFQVKIGGILIDVEYSHKKNEIISYGVDSDSRTEKDDKIYIQLKDEAVRNLEYALYEIKTVCKMMMDII